ncbi:MAG: DNA topology modulation protein [Pyrinomonadaceae bacterium]
MKKVLIIGSSGAGKSTLARRLSEKTGLKIIHLDKIYWKPNWTEPEKDEWKRTLEKVIQNEEWIMDGNFSGTLDLRLPACDTVIFLETPPAVCIYRVLKRVAFSYNKTRSDMADGCPEKFDWEFLKWIWDFENRSKWKMEKLLEQFKNEKTIIRLKSKREVEDFFVNLETNKVKSL